MSALAEQHERWTEARSRLWRSLPVPVKPPRQRPVSPFVRETIERRQKALQTIAEAFPAPTAHRLFLAPIVRLDEYGNAVEDTPEQRLVAPKWKQIAREVGKKHGVSLNELVSHRRSRPIVVARHEAFWRCRNETSLSYPQIGRLFGGRDHTTVLWGIRQHEKRIAHGTTL